jgi:thioredoxin reductase
LQVASSVEKRDVIVVGGGPAGLSCALVLGRCRREVLVIDDGHPRNAASAAAHGYFTRDGASPAELLAAGRAELAPYGVEIRDDTVVRAEREGDGFVLTTGAGARHRAHKLVLATGLTDELPAVPGADAMFGKSLFHCPYCDGWEVRDRPLAVIGRGEKAVQLALGLTTWSPDLILCTDGWNRFTRPQRASLAGHRIAIRTEKIAAFQHTDGRLEAIQFQRGEPVAREAAFFQGRCRPRSPLAAQLGCEFTRSGAVVTRSFERASGGLYVVGDASRDVHFIAVAVAEGVRAAYAINHSLRVERTARILNGSDGMKLNPQITYRDVAPNPALDRSIRASARRLDRYHPAILGCRIAVEAPHRHHRKGRPYRVRIDLSVPGKELVVGRHPQLNPAHEDLHVALRDAFRAARRELQDHARTRRGDVKQHDRQPLPSAKNGIRGRRGATIERRV